MLSKPVKDFQEWLHYFYEKVQEQDRHEIDENCVRIRRAEIRLIRDNGRSRIDWRNY